MPNILPLKSSHCLKRSGFTLVELLISIAIMAILLKISLSVFYSITRQQSLDKDVETAYSYLLRARNQTINGEGGSNYGVRFASTSISLFSGSVYNPANVSSTYSFLNKSYTLSVNLTGNVSDVYFQKISGSPSATGTIIFRNLSDSTVQKMMTIHGSGLVEVQ